MAEHEHDRAWRGDAEKFGEAFTNIITRRGLLTLDDPRPQSSLADAVERLRAAQHTGEQKMERFVDWIGAWCKRQSTLPLKDQDPLARVLTQGRQRITPENVCKAPAVLGALKRRFAESLWVEVLPADVVAACKVAAPSKVVLDLEQGSLIAPWTHFETGEPVLVHIYSWQLDHLLERLPDPLPRPVAPDPAPPVPVAPELLSA